MFFRIVTGHGNGHCTEEALISKTFDMAERRRRLVPLIFERVELPVWLHPAVGIDFTPTASIDPLQRLVTLFRGSTEERSSG